MTKQNAATLSVVMAIVMWPIGAFGIFSTLGDLIPDITPYEAWQSKALFGGLPMTLAFGLFVSAAWLSGYSFSEAKRRSITSLLLCVPGFAFPELLHETLAPDIRFDNGIDLTVIAEYVSMGRHELVI